MDDLIERVDWGAYREEAAEFLSELIRIDTTNPPGNETAAARFLLERFTKEGIPGEILEGEPGRGNFIARLTGRGGGAGPKLLFLSHTDVVPVADPSRWTHPPFSGVIADGWVWGRGALDMKGQAVVEALVMFLFKRLGVEFHGELIYLAVADEERGGGKGAGWLLAEHPELLKVDYVINEGGGAPLKLGGRIFYPIENVEKGVLWLELKVRGRSGHGSIPHEDNALAKAARLIDRVASYRFPKRIAPSVEKFITKVMEAIEPAGAGRQAARAILSPGEEPEPAELARLLEGTPLEPNLVNAFIRTTISPTMVRAGVKENVIPDGCELVLDCRLIPGSTREEVLAKLEELAREAGLAPEDLQVEVLQYHPPSESPVETDFYRAIEKALLEELPEVEAVPFLLTGATDSRFLREAGALAYGFCPLSTKMDLSERMRLVHGDNERIDLESLELGVRVLARLACELLGAAATT